MLIAAGFLIFGLIGHKAARPLRPAPARVPTTHSTARTISFGGG
jgi:hypothetical protein